MKIIITKRKPSKELCEKYAYTTVMKWSTIEFQVYKLGYIQYANHSDKTVYIRIS